MPFTPIHLGPGALLKAAGGRHFSFMVFGGAQVLMDIEPLLAIINDWPVLHGPSHTVPGALVIGALAIVTGKPISTWVLTALRIPHYPLTWLAASTGALLGTLSHVGFDAVMHSDMNPLWPLAQGNALLGIISIDHLHVLCAALGALGAAGVALRFRLRGPA